MKKHLLIYCLFIFTPFVIAAQTSGEIEGYIFGPDKTELEGATISTTYKGQIKLTQTDKKGKFVLKPLDAGVYSITITFMGYDTIINNSINVFTGTTRIKDVFMKENSIVLGPTVIDGSGTEIIDRPVNAKIPYMELKDLPVEKGCIACIIMAKTTDIKLDDKTNKVIVRGARPTSTSYVVDGIRMENDPMLPSRAIGSVEVFTGGIPAKYGDVTGGVIVVKTRTYFDVYNEKKMKEILAEYKANQSN